MKTLQNTKEYNRVDILPSFITDVDLLNIARDEGETFLQINLSDCKLPDQGFKIHISTTLANYQRTLDAVFNFCKSRRIDFKYICNYDLLEKNLAGSDDNIVFSGKFITIYPNSFENFKKYIEELYNVQQLKVDSSIFIVTDRRYKDSNNIFYRYGAIARKDGCILSPDGIRIKDNREIGYNLPSFIEEPFPNNYDDRLDGKYIFKKYIPEGSLNFKSSGSVFEVRKIDDNKIYIMKNARIGFSDSCNSAIDLLKKEKHNLLALRQEKVNFVPAYVDSFYEDKDYFLIETKIKGKTVDDFRSSIDNNFSDKNLRKSTVCRYKKVLLDLLNKVEYLHEKDVYIGDISSRNIIINDNGEVYFIDLPQLTFLDKENVKQHYRARDFSDDEIPFLTDVEQDNRQVGYLIMTLFCRANMFLLLDNTGNTSIKFYLKYADNEKLPSIFVEVVKVLTSTRITSLKSIIEKLKNANLNEYYSYPVVENNSLEELKVGLSRTIKCMNIDNIIFKSTVPYLRNEKDGNLDNFRQIQEKIYQGAHISDNSGSLVFKYIKEKSYDKLDCLEDWITILTCYMVSAQKNDKDTIDDLLTTMFERFCRYVDQGESNIYFRMKMDENKFSPYLANGTAGVLVFLLMYRDKFNSSKWDDQIYECVRILSKIKMPKTGGLYYGLAGIVYALLRYVDEFNADDLKHDIRMMLNNLKFYILIDKTNLFLVDSLFTDVNINFMDGNEGLIFVIDMAERLKI